MAGRKRKRERYGGSARRKPGGNVYGQAGFTAFCAAGLFSIIYMMKGMFPFGEGSILITDLYSQYVPLLYRFYDVAGGAKNLFMDFGVSGGANLYGDTINELLNPFNYVLFLFGREEIYRAVNVILMLYVVMSAASANWLLLKIWPQKREWNTVLSLCYAFSGYMAYNYQIIKWMYFPVLFPLFVLALYRLLREKKGIWYAVLLGYQLVLSVQLGFMTLLFVLFACGFYFIFCVEKKDRPGTVCRLGLYTLAGVLLSAAVLAPNIAILFSSSRAEENLSYLEVMKRHGLDDLFERLFQIAHPVLLALTAVLTAGLLRRGIRFRQLTGQVKFLYVLNGFLWLTVLLQPANLLWHMGSYVCFPVRYAYMALLCGICLIKSLLMETEGWENAGTPPERATVKQADGTGRIPLLGISRNSLVRLWFSWLGAVLFCIVGLAKTLEWEDRIVQAFSSLAISSVCPKETAVVCLIMVLFLGAAVCGLLSGRQQSAFAALAAAFCGICFYTMIFLPQDYGVRLENEAAYRLLARQAAGAAGEDGLLARNRDEESLPLNAALVNRQGSLSGYFPTASRRMKEAMEGLGYLTPWVSTRSVGGTTVSDDVLRQVLVFETPAGGLQLSGSSVLEKQEELAGLASGKSLLKVYGRKEAETYDAGSFYLHVEDRRTLWLDPGRTADGIRVWVNGAQLEIPEASSAYSPHRIIALGAFEEEEVKIFVTDLNGAVLQAGDMELAALDDALWTESLRLLRLHGEKDKTAGSYILPQSEYKVDERRGQITAKLNGGEGQTLFFPFAALDGWKCVQNGRKVDIIPVLGGFMGITLEEGENEICLSFTPPGFFTGAALTLLGAAGLLGSFFLKRAAKRKENAAGWEKASAALFGIVWIGGLAAVYVIPAAGLALYLIFRMLGMGG